MDIAKEPSTLSIEQITKAWANRTLRPNEEYQRGEAWSISQQKMLIDSVLRGYPLPRFYFHQKTEASLLGTSESTFDIIDGQQRIIAMAEFVADHWSLFDLNGKQKVPMPTTIRQLPCPWSGRTFSQLDDGLREQFLATEVPVVMITGVATTDEIRDLFIRLQAGTALTRQQVRDAWPGNVGPYIISLAGKLKSHPRFRTFSSVDKRGTAREDTDGLTDNYLDDRQTCAQLMCLLIERDSSNEIASVSTQALDNLYHTNTEFNPRGVLAERFERILNWCDEVLERRPTTAYGRLIKVRKNVLFSIFLLLEDLDASRRTRIDLNFVKRLAVEVWSPNDPEEVEPSGRVSSAATIARHYNWFITRKLRSLTVAGYDTARLFNEEQKGKIWENFNGMCGICGLPLDHGREEYDHITPWIRGGPTSVENGRPVHPGCHQRGRNVGLAPVATRARLGEKTS